MKNKVKILFEQHNIDYVAMSNVSQCTYIGSGMYRVWLYTGGMFELQYL